MTTSPTHVFTIGFTKTSAQHFFERLRSAGIKKLVDVRLHSTSQLSGFAKSNDLAYFAKSILGIEYIGEPLLAPTDQMLSAYKKNNGDWSTYAAQFLDLMRARRVEDRLTPNVFDMACLLCSEPTPHHCHRRLVCEYFAEKWKQPLLVRHL